MGVVSLRFASDAGRRRQVVDGPRDTRWHRRRASDGGWVGTNGVGRCNGKDAAQLQRR